METVQFTGQRKGEKVVFILKRHWSIIVPYFMQGGFPLAIGLLMPFFQNTGEILFGNTILALAYVVWMVFWASYIIYYFVGWYNDRLIVTTQRVIDIDQQGIWTKRVGEMELSKIQTIRHEISGLHATLHNIGDLHLMAHNSSATLVIEGIENPAKVQERILRLVQKVTASSPLSAEELVRQIQEMRPK